MPQKSLDAELKINSFPGFCPYFRHTYFLVHLLMAISPKGNKNFKSVRQPNIQLMLQKNLLKMLMIRFRVDSAKCFLTNYCYKQCVTFIPARFYVLKVNNSQHQDKALHFLKFNNVHNRMTSVDVVLVSFLLTLGIFHTQFQCFYCQISTRNCHL